MKKTILVSFVIPFIMMGCGSTNITGQNDKKIVNVSSEEENVDIPYLVLDNKYNVVFNNDQKQNKFDREAIDNSVKTWTQNYEKVKVNIDEKQPINIIPLSYNVIKNSNSKMLGLNLFVVNTSDKTISDFKTLLEFTFNNSTFTDSDMLEMNLIGMNQLKKNEGVLISYATDIADQPEEYFDNFNIEDVTITLTDLSVTTE